MDEIRQWLIGIISAALLAALADGLMPKGAIRQVGKLVCALVLLCALLRPVLVMRLPDLMGTSVGTVGEMEQQRAQLEQRSGQLLKTIIERESAAYIVDKAAGLGLNCRAQVTCVAGEGGAWLPRYAHITGHLEEEERAKLMAAIQSELGIAPECQVYAGGEEVEMEYPGGDSGVESSLGPV